MSFYLVNLNKKPSYRRACYVSKSMLCFTSYGVRKVSNNKSDFQGRSRALAMVPLN